MVRVITKNAAMMKFENIVMRGDTHHGIWRKILLQKFNKVQKFKGRGIAAK
jgi:hypothetical protein